MKILPPRIVGLPLVAVVVLGCGFGAGWVSVAPEAQGQAPGANPAPKGAAAGRATPKGQAPAPWTALHTSPQSVVSQQGIWAEVVTSTSRWIVVQTLKDEQNQGGQQLPIAADRIRQFLVRWPSAVGDLSPSSMVEATGPQTSSTSMMTDHIDVYEADAQNLVSPTIQSVAGPNQGGPVQVNTSNFSFIDFETLNFGSRNWTEIPSAGTSNWTELPSITNGSMLLHVVGRSAAINPIQLGGFGPGLMTVAPGPNGMSVTQVTLGTNSYAKKGDLVHLVADSAAPRSLDVSQLVLYKKIPLRRFQP